MSSAIALDVADKAKTECDGQLHSVKPWRVDDFIGKPLGRCG